MADNVAMWEAAQAFLVVAKNTETYIREEGISDENSQPYKQGGALTPMRIWIAMRSVLDFNFHQAYELYIKLVLTLEGTPYKFQHGLGEMFDLMSNESRGEFQRLHRKNLMGRGKTVEMIAFQMASKRPSLPEPTDPDFNTVRGMLEYFDGELELYKRRYGWETMTRGGWLQFIRDIRPWLLFLDDINAYCASLLDRQKPT
ncbi:MAG: hypothetical protein OXH52_06980 [Gammaproteobacteria bacterium]|nr:hypothetical protein [Gammaproteobacteria bacterium]